MRVSCLATQHAIRNTSVPVSGRTRTIPARGRFAYIYGVFVARPGGSGRGQTHVSALCRITPDWMQVYHSLALFHKREKTGSLSISRWRFFSLCMSRSAASWPPFSPGRGGRGERRSGCGSKTPPQRHQLDWGRLSRKLPLSLSRDYGILGQDFPPLTNPAPGHNSAPRPLRPSVQDIQFYQERDSSPRSE